MLITLKRGNLTLASSADWDEGRVTGELVTECEREMEVLALLGADGVSVYDHLTRSIESEFTVTRRHASVSAALVFAKTHEALVLGKANLVITWTEDDTTYTLTSEGCAWRTAGIRIEGVSTDVVYRVKGPPFVATSTDDEGSVEPEGEYLYGGAINGGNYGPVPGVLYGGRIGSLGLPGAALVSNVSIASLVP